MDSNKYHDDYDKEPYGRGNPYYRCVHCKISSPSINGRIEGHERGCFYRECKEAGFDYNRANFKRIHGYDPQEETGSASEGPDDCDGPAEAGFYGPRPWNNFDDSQERAEATVNFVGSILGRS